jgi:hypothetical protein
MPTTGTQGAFRVGAVLATLFANACSESPRIPVPPTPTWPLPPAGELGVAATGAAIGVEDSAGNDELQLGRVRGVAIDGAGGAYILELGNGGLHHAARSGAVTAKSLRRGSGPGEFWEPAGIAAFANGEIAVADGPTRRVSLYLTKRDGAVEFARSFSLDFDPTDVCAFGQVLVLAGEREGAFLHVYDLSGRRLRSFGAGFGDSLDLPLTRLSKSRSIVACSESGKFIAQASALSPEVRLYDGDSTNQLWSTVLDDSPSVTWTPGAKGSVTLSEPDGGYDQRVGLVFLDSTRLYVSLRRSAWNSSTRTHDEHDHGRVLSVSNGMEALRTPDGPSLVAWDQRLGLGYSVEEDPFPRVIQYRTRKSTINP